MKKQLLDQRFFARPVLHVAPDLLGKYLAYSTGAGKGALMVTEVEAYDGELDLACHASKGRTKRTEVLYGEPGTLYVYLCYGVHWLLNVVTTAPEYPAGVLIRGVAGISGPGRVTRALGVTGAMYGKPAVPKTGVWFEDRGVRVAKRNIQKTPRIGVDYAGEWAAKPYRFVLKR